MNEYVRSMRFVEDRAINQQIVSARVRPSMRQGYYSSSLNLGDEEVLEGSCDCKSGASGTCKHVDAVAFHFWLYLSSLKGKIVG